MPAISSGGAGHAGRLYLASSQISHAAVRSHSRQELLENVVRVLVESGGFAMASAAWYDPESHELKPVARFGNATGYIDQIHIFGDERPEGRGPAGTAFRSGACYICQDIMKDPRTVPWREAAAACGWRASAAIPISMGGVPRGVISAYSTETGIFGPEEVSLFGQVAADVSIGLDRLDAEEKARDAQAALADSERRLKLVMDAAGIGTFEWDMKTGRLFWDERSEHLFGYESGGFDGTYPEFVRRIYPEDRAKVERSIAVALNAHTPMMHEFRIVWPDGSIHWISSRGEFTYDEAGVPLRLYGATFNIDERKRTEVALAESEERLRQAIRVSGLGIFDHDHTRDTIYWSPEQRAIHGVDADTRVTLDLFQSRVHPDDRARIAERVRQAHDPRGDGLFDVEHRLLLPDGSVHWTRTRSQTFFEGEGGKRHPVRTVGAVTDITDPKRAEEEQKKLVSLVEMSNEFIGIATLPGSILYLNNAAMQLVGIESVAEVREKTIFDFIAAADRRRVAAEVYPALSKEGFWSGELRLRNFRTGDTVFADVTTFYIRDDRGAPLYIATVTRDIRDRKKAEAERTRLEASLFQAQKMESIGRLAGGVAHDFNNMLTVILGFAELALAKVREPEVVQLHLTEIVKAAERSRQITQQLLGFSRQQLIAPKPVDLNAILEDLRNPLARLIGEDVRLSFHPDPKLWKALLDPSQINQILLNLAINAREAMPKGGELTIETANAQVTQEYTRTQANITAGPYVMIVVSDNGCGMTRDTQRHLFEPFFTTKEKGTGLGLATVYGIVKQNGGFVNVYSEVDKGTTFRIYFPSVAGESESPELPPAPAKTGAGSVLLVEDDELVRGVTTAALQSLGYTPLVATSAQEALDLCTQPGAAIRLILTDVVMPGMNGAELRDRVNAIRPDIKVLFMSGYTSNVIVTHGVLKKGIHFIQKPFSIEELGRKIAEILGPPGDASTS